MNEDKPSADAPIPASLAELVEAHDWGSTPLGPRAGWSVSLRTTVQTVLACRLPMYVAWGPQLVQIYNDAYRPILGDKHPAIGRTTPQTWPEIWPRIGPMWQEVLQGASLGFDDFRLTINRYGYPEDCWFNFSYSPVTDDDGSIAGVLVTFAETTDKIRVNRALAAEQHKLQLALDAAEMGWWHYDPAKDHAAWDTRFKRIFGMDCEQSANSAAIERILPEDRQAVTAALDASLDPHRRERFSVEYRIRHPEEGVRWIEAHGLAAFPPDDPAARAASLVGTVTDITSRKLAHSALAQSEARARTVADRLALAMSAARMGDWSWDAQSDMVTMSERAGEIFGIPAGPHLTWNAMRELLHEDDRERAREAVERAVAERRDYDIEYRVLVDGDFRWVLARGRAIYDAAGGATGMLGVVQDISSRKALEEALGTRGRNLEILNRTGAMIGGELDVHRVVAQVTDAATELSGAQFGAFFYNVTDARGESYMLYSLSGVDRSHFERFPMPRATALFGPTFRGEGVIRLGDVRKDPRYGRSDTFHGMPPGHLPVVSYLAVPAVSRSGEVLGGLFFGHERADVFTEAHEKAVQGLAAQAAVAVDNSRLHEQVQASLRTAEAANRIKDEFLATVSHELRTPLTSIVGWLHLLRGGKLGPDDQKRALDTIDRSVKAQQQLIEDILDVSRIVAGKLRVDLAPIELAAAVDAAIESLQPLLAARQIRFTRLLDAAVTVLGDPGRLQQVVWNLVANAIKYTPRGGRIAVTLRQIDSRVELAVSDNGEGIAADFLPLVFDRFQQSDSSTTRAHGGIGLGLAIVRHLVELHGGRVEARSDGPGKGSEFVITLPVAPASARERNTAEGEAPRSEPRLADYDLAGLTVLAVDDEHDTRVLLAAILQGAGARVITAASAAEAMCRVEDARPDVVVSDIGMPGEDGYAFAKRLRARAAGDGGSTPAAALTAYARPEDRVQCLAAGFQAHMAKPVSPAELVAVVAALAGRPARAPASAR